MSKLIPTSFIDDLLTRIDITEIVGTRVKLRKAGNNFQALCPFHSEKTPSFTVSQVKQFYHCFGCGAHGSAIGFLMQFENLSFVDAVTNLASMAGLALPAETQQNNSSRFREIFTLTNQVAKFYQQQLKCSTIAINYLKSRGLTGETCKKFGIGFAPNSWDNLVTIYHKNQQIKNQLITAGLLIAKDNKTYSRFRERIMFPIRNRKGDVIGFGGRTLGRDSAKYLNSPETPIYHKGQELYGLYEACKATSNLQKIIVVEGYMDVIALAQHGINNVVATSGTAITTKQVQHLLRLTNDICFCFDGDNAGRSAAWRALEIIVPLMREGFQISFLFLPEKEDPDSLIRKEGNVAFAERFATALPLADFLFKHLSSKSNLRTLDGRATLAKNVKTLLQTMPNSVYKELLFNQLASLVKIDVNELKKDNYIKNYKTSTVAEPASIHTTISRAITLLLHYPQLAKDFSHNQLFSIEVSGIKILEQLIYLLKSQPDLTLGAILEHWRDQPEAGILANLAAKEPIIPNKGWKDEFQGSIQVIYQLGQEQLIKSYMLKAATSELNSTEKATLQHLITIIKTPGSGDNSLS